LEMIIIGDSWFGDELNLPRYSFWLDPADTDARPRQKSDRD
jgi:hypothetical protein